LKAYDNTAFKQFVACWDMTEFNLDGSPTIVKTRNTLPVFDKHSYVLASADIVAGNHSDAFNLKSHPQSALKCIKRQDLSIQGSYFTADGQCL
jgi:hypothetical protein